MKLKILVKLAELILGDVFSDDEPRADMYLPIWLLGFSLILMLGAVGIAIYTIFNFSIIAIVVAVIALFTGIMALLCWKNQAVRMLSDNEFEYTTFLGNKKTYSFSEITGLKQNSDSMTLILGHEKVHIESCAKLTQRFADRVDKELSRIYENQ